MHVFCPGKAADGNAEASSKPARFPPLHPPGGVCQLRLHFFRDQDCLWKLSQHLSRNVARPRVWTLVGWGTRLPQM